jgi:septal ring factor EnvC (AmiA/AmiB activator)
MRFVALICLIAMLCAPDSRAEEREGRRNLGEIRERIESARQDRDRLKARREATDKDLAAIERNYGRLAAAIAGLEPEVRSRAARVKELDRKRAALAMAARNQQLALAGQARAAFAAGRMDWLKLLANQENPSRLTRILAYHSYLNRARALILQEAKRQSAEAGVAEAELSAEVERLNRARKRLSTDMAALNDSRRHRQRLMAELDHELADRDEEIERLKEDEQRLQDLLTTIQRSGPDGSPDARPPAPPTSLPPPDVNSDCPVPGRMAEQFGSPRANGRWDGVLIEAAEGTPVRAAAAGRVAFAEWLRGYGLLIIIDHGGGVMSLYGFNQTLFKEAGDSVAPGEVIAAVGASSGRKVPGLYFGIRQQGRAVDPLPWCRRVN